MAQATTLATSEAGPSTFPSNLDFIAFDASDDEAQGEANGEGDARAGSDLAPLGHDALADRRSSQANGKKRKTNDDAVDVPKNSTEGKKREARKGTPWCVDVDFDQCPTCADVLHDELIAFEHWISPTRIEHETRKLVIKMIAKAIVGQWPDADVRAFGSQNTQLYMPQGDIDLVVISRRMDERRREDILRSMAACLRRNNLATDIQVIAKAKVPIIKFVCTYGKYKVDISINQTNGLDASKFVSDWLKRCPALRPIIMATKLLLSQRGVSEVFSGGLGSYSVICLAISHMQMHPKVQRGEIDPIRNLGVLFLEFLELYGKNFGYDEVGISVAGRGCYFRKMARGWKNERQALMLSIEDPGDATNDISKGSFNMRDVKQAFSGAFDIMTAVMCEAKGRKKRSSHHRHLDEDEEAREALIDGARSGDGGGGDKDPESLLGHIVGVNRDMLKARRDIQQLWESGTLQFKMGKPAPQQEPLPTPRAPGGHQLAKETPRAPKALREKEEKKCASAAAKEKRREEEKDSKKKRKEARRAEKAEKKAKIGLSIKGSAAAQISNTSEGTAAGVRGTASDPVVVMDDSSKDEGQRRSDMARDFLPIDLDASPVLAARDERDDDDDNDNDTKYSSNRSRSKARKSRLDDFAKSAPDTFVLDDSASEEEGAAAGESPEEGEVVVTGVKKRKVGHGEEEEAKRKRKREYWEGKGSSTIGQHNDDDDDNY